MNRRAIRIALIPLLPVLVVVGYLVWVVVGSSDETQEPVDISASGPMYATVDELGAASDHVVHGEVVAIEDGRAITDPDDPTAGVSTQLATVEVTSIAKGPSAATIVVEQEARLLDGTPITVDGVSPLDVGDRGWFFLIDGDGEEFPYTALTTTDGFAAEGSARASEVDQFVASASAPIVPASIPLSSTLP